MDDRDIDLQHAPGCRCQLAVDPREIRTCNWVLDSLRGISGEKGWDASSLRVCPRTS